MSAGADHDYGLGAAAVAHILSADFSFSSRFSSGACPTDTCITRRQRPGFVQDSEKSSGSYNSQG